MANSNDKVLFRIKNLKQYYPVGKNLFCKANDGITLDIYEGETLGLVGESGCGKSTFGRTILQLYRQTDGHTLYYGETEHTMAPVYVKKTIKQLDKLRKNFYKKRKQREEVEAEYAKITEEGKEKFDKLEQLNRAKTAEEDALFYMTKVVGGLIVREDLAPVIDAYTEVYNHSLYIRGQKLKRRDAKVRYDDAVYKIEKAKEKNATKPLAESSRDRYNSKIAEIDKRIADREEKLAKSERKLDELRRQHAGDPTFEEYEAMRDDGIDLARLTYNEIRTLRNELQMIFQDPYSSLNPRMTVANIIGEGMLEHKMYRHHDDRMREHILKTMDDAGLQGYFIYRYPHQFSGGQRQRIGIARSLAVNPKFVVCDEAVSALDVSIQSQIINLLEDLKEQENLTYLFITHDLSVIKYISDRVAVMYLGNIVELAPSADLYANPRHPYTLALMSAIPTTDLTDKREMIPLEGDIPSPINPPTGCKFHTRCEYCTDICVAVIPEFEDLGDGHFVACHHKLPKGLGI
ncbi:MAG TPA: oligopeptide/dipeptide ABC transporter ATP-binding protein [Oscillospiraceae bacterium]|nr:oligopeptide/dipeptide ABC transporter ATP-binding protein [Oscillospiraceae bacterium]